jgi:hypothetical protein
MIEDGDTHIGVATDHVIESFRNKLWPGYKTGEGIEPALLAQFHPFEEALKLMGVVVWPMIDLEADDALASAAHKAFGPCWSSPAQPLFGLITNNRSYTTQCHRKVFYFKFLSTLFDFLD